MPKSARASLSVHSFVGHSAACSWGIPCMPLLPQWYARYCRGIYHLPVYSKMLPWNNFISGVVLQDGIIKAYLLYALNFTCSFDIWIVCVMGFSWSIIYENYSMKSKSSVNFTLFYPFVFINMVDKVYIFNWYFIAKPVMKNVTLWLAVASTRLEHLNSKLRQRNCFGP